MNNIELTAFEPKVVVSVIQEFLDVEDFSTRGRLLNLAIRFTSAQQTGPDRFEYVDLLVRNATINGQIDEKVENVLLKLNSRDFAASSSEIVRDLTVERGLDPRVLGICGSDQDIPLLLSYVEPTPLNYEEFRFRHDWKYLLAAARLGDDTSAAEIFNVVNDIEDPLVRAKRIQDFAKYISTVQAVSLLIPFLTDMQPVPMPHGEPPLSVGGITARALAEMLSNEPFDEKMVYSEDELLQIRDWALRNDYWEFTSR